LEGGTGTDLRTARNFGLVAATPEASKYPIPTTVSWNGTTPIPSHHMPVLLGLPLYDRSIYLYLVEKGKETSKGLADKFQTPEGIVDLSETRKAKSTLEEALARLQKLHLIRKERGPRDRRSWEYSVDHDLYEGP
jgi:predicted transcriptional regulator